MVSQFKVSFSPINSFFMPMKGFCNNTNQQYILHGRLKLVVPASQCILYTGEYNPIEIADMFSRVN